MIKEYFCREFSSKEIGDFNISAYSKFKYGHIPSTVLLAEDMALSFFLTLKNHYEKHGKTKTVIVSSPYLFIPNACDQLREYLVLIINLLLVEKGYEPLEQLKMHREKIYEFDYSKMSYEDRVKTMSEEKFYVDKKYVENKLLIFFDDIYITGGHHEHIMKTIKDDDLENVTKGIIIAYYAKVTDGKENPDIEFKLNHHYVKDCDSLFSLIHHGFFKINTRIIKFILQRPADEFDAFCHNILTMHGRLFLLTIKALILSNGYQKLDKHKRNFKILNNVIN